MSAAVPTVNEWVGLALTFAPLAALNIFAMCRLGMTLRSAFLVTAAAVVGLASFFGGLYLMGV